MIVIGLSCADSSHDAPVPLRLRLIRDGGGWRTDAPPIRRPVPGMSPAAEWTSGSRGDYRTDDGFSPPVVKFRLRCDKCGFDLQVKADRLGEPLDMLAENGVPSITLQALGRMVLQ